jgi:hypothetical protein
MSVNVGAYYKLRKKNTTNIFEKIFGLIGYFIVPLGINRK